MGAYLSGRLLYFDMSITLFVGKRWYSLSCGGEINCLEFSTRVLRRFYGEHFTRRVTVEIFFAARYYGTIMFNDTFGYCKHCKVCQAFAKKSTLLKNGLVWTSLNKGG